MSLVELLKTLLEVPRYDFNLFSTDCNRFDLQYVLPPNSVVYTGCVGDDALAEQLKAANKREGLDEVYQVLKGGKTGACAVVITGHHRSLVTDLQCAEKFDQAHLSSPQVAPLIEEAKVFYIEGYFLTHGTASALELSQKASKAGKVRLYSFILLNHHH